MAEVWSGARRLAQPFLSSLAETELSGVAILDLLRGEGLGYRMTQFYDDLRRYRQVGIRRPYVESLLPTDTVPRSWMAEQPSEIWHITDPHKGVFEVVLADPDTGEAFTKTFDQGFPREMTVEEAEGYMRDTVDWGVSGDGMTLLEVTMIGWKHLAGTSY